MSAVIRGLPEQLPEGERLLWQGAPNWRILAQRGFHLRKLALYFAILVLWVGKSSINGGATATETALAVLKAGGLALIPLVLIALYAWVVARSTVYTLTDKRIAIRAGLAVPLTINIPFARIASAAVTSRPDGSGDVAVTLLGGDRLAYFVLWPHARPWRLARAEPSMRGLADVQQVAVPLARALAASAEMAAPILHDPATAPKSISKPATIAA